MAIWSLKGFQLSKRSRERGGGVGGGGGGGGGEGGGGGGGGGGGVRLLSECCIEHHAKATGRHKVMTDGAFVEHAYLNRVGCCMAA